MRTSSLLLATLKETPNDAEITSHRLMLRAGLIRKLSSGLYNWLPLGLKILRKVEAVVRQEMEAIGAQEILMPAIQPAELWQESGRWEQYGPLMLKMQDRHKREFCFGPTHEEVVTDLVRKEIKSYKQLPLCLYQIQTKFRDEIRPRFGVMRAREFIMKDAYSFHLTEACLQKTYQAFYEAYTKIFTRLGLQFRAVLADTGEIGGSQSHEFHVLAESGEDLIVYSKEGTYAANLEMATAAPGETSYKTVPQKAKGIMTTPGIKSVSEQAQHMQLPVSSILKTILVKGSNENTVVGLLLRGDHEINPIKAEKLSQVSKPLSLISPEAVLALTGTVPGFIGPINLDITFIADESVVSMSNFSCGANANDTHYININWDRDLPLPLLADIRKVVEGDKSPDGVGTLSFLRGIEVGHIFQLGTTYSEAMQARVLNETGKTHTMTMGCYGIGISRIIAAAIEQNHDHKGILWPQEMAPFQLALIPINYYKSKAVRLAADALYQQLLQAGIEVILDDRDERAGTLFADMELIGIPHRLVLSDKTLANNSIEYKNRKTDAVEDVKLDFIPHFIKDKLNGFKPLH